MFQSPKKRLRALLDVVDDMLVGAPEANAPVPHPHARTVSLRIERRGGTVAPRPAHCLSPVRPAEATGRVSTSARAEREPSR